MSEFVDDIKARIIAGLTEKLGVTPETAGMVATEVVGGLREAWAGCEPYINKGNSNGQRNRAIIRDWKNGESVPLLARRYSLSRVRIWQIVKG